MSATATNASLYVGDLHPDTTEQELHQFFSQVGPIVSVRLCRDVFTHRSLCYGYVNFQRPEDAERAIDSLNFSQLQGKQIRIMWCQRDPAMRRSGVGNIFISGLAPSIDTRALYDTFSRFGNVMSCKVVYDENGRSRGRGFVHFETQEAALNAIKTVNENFMEGSKVYVTEWKTVAERVRQANTSFTNLYARGFDPESFTEEQLRAVFARFGPISSCVMMKTPEGKSRGFGFVDYGKDGHAAALAAVETLNEKPVEGSSDRTWVVARAQKKWERRAALQRNKPTGPGGRNPSNLYVKNLDETVDENKLREMFSRFGTITSTRVVRDADGVSRLFGYVNFATPEEAQQAIVNMHQTVPAGARKPLYVALHQPKEQRQAYLESARVQYTSYAQPAPGQFPMNQFPGAAGMLPGAMFFSPSPMAFPPQQFPAGMRPQGWNPAMGMTPAGNFNAGMNRGGAAGRVGGRQPASFRGGRGAQGAGQRGGYAGAAAGGAPAGAVPGGNYKLNPNARNREAGMLPAGAMAPAGAAMPAGVAPPTAADLSAQLAQATPEERRNMLGERLFPMVQSYCGDRAVHAPKVTGMLLQMEPQEVLLLLESPSDLAARVNEAIQLIESAYATPADAAATPGEQVAASS